MITARPILFSAPMIRALLDGRKTQTRRIVTKQAALDCLAAGFEPSFLTLPGNSDLCPYGRPGDLLWVRESWAGIGGEPWYMADGREKSYSACDAHEGGGYPATCRDIGENCCAVTRQTVRWTPSIHMPRWASRLTLRLTDVRVQRLQEISQADAIAEGCPAVSLWDLDCASTPPSHHFRALWDSINGAGAWDANPWVWALTFEVVRANIDLVLQEQAA